MKRRWKIFWIVCAVLAAAGLILTAAGIILGAPVSGLKRFIENVRDSTSHDDS